MWQPYELLYTCYLLTYLLTLLQRYIAGTDIQTDGKRDGWTPYRYIDPAAYYASSVDNRMFAVLDGYKPIVTLHAVWSFIPFVTIRTRGHHIHQKMSYMRPVGLLRRLYERK